MKLLVFSHQELLVRAGAVLWLDAAVRLLVDSHEPGVGSDKVEEWSSVVLKNGGVLTWPLLGVSLLPTAALTHPNMFPFFHTDKHNYDFQQVRFFFFFFFFYPLEL